MSATARNQVFTAVHTVGTLLPADMLDRISLDRDVPGSRPANYGLPSSRSVADEAERSWERLKPLWRELRRQLPPDSTTGHPAPDPTGIAETDWLNQLWRELDFGPLSSIGEAGIAADSDDEKRFPVSHRWQHALIHHVPHHHGLDAPPDGAGTVRPQSMLQECLNRTDAHLWAILTNGRQLRLLRDSAALATASYVEFDLEAIFDGELFSEYVLLYRTVHVSRFQVPEDQPPAMCWLEKWRSEAIESGTRALDQLRDGVQRAITTLGTGFLRHPDNSALREHVDVTALHSALLRLAYRLIFVFAAEDRAALLDPDVPPQAQQRYEQYFSAKRLRRQAFRRPGTDHSDLYQSLRFVLQALGEPDGRPELGIVGLGGLFNDTDADAPLRGLSLSNAALLEAVRHLARVRDGRSSRWRPVDYRNMGAEELGSVYESLLELVPRYSATDRTFELADRIGNDRKKTGSYYTPTSLIDTLLDSTLDPVIDDAQKRGEQRAHAAGEIDPSKAIERELLSLTICDPACGSGHFLVAASRRLAKRIAAVREQNPEPTIDTVRHALHQVVSRCIYGVDLNPMAVELAKVSLWLEALAPGRPLGFLDAHVKLGNGLVGATPALMRDGIPDRAFKPVEGDDRKWARDLAKRNSVERGSTDTLFELDTHDRVANSAFAAGLRRITDASIGDLRDVHAQEAAFEEWAASDQYRHAVRLADAWCAAFVWNKNKEAPPAITHSLYRGLEEPDGHGVPQAVHDEIDRLAEQYRFFHWHLEFPEIFTVPEGNQPDLDVDSGTGWAGGFSCVIGNPPWDKLDFEDKKYFDTVEPSIAAISGLKRRNRIADWEKEDPDAGARYRAARRRVKATFHFAGDSGVFPLCAKGLTVKGVNSLQTDQLFTERFTSLVNPKGRIGAVVPTSVATGAGAQHLFAALTDRRAISSLYDFENKQPLFENVHASYKFCLLSLTGRGITVEAARYAFFLHHPTDLGDSSRAFELSSDDISTINPNTRSLPIFRNSHTQRIATSIHENIPVLWNEVDPYGNIWRITFKNLFNMTDDSGLFRTRDELIAEDWKMTAGTYTKQSSRMVPLREAKMIDFFNHRAADVIRSNTATTRQNQPNYLEIEDLRTPDRFAQPLYWVPEKDTETYKDIKAPKNPSVYQRLHAVAWEHDWLCGWCDVTSSTNERTAIPALIPRTAVGHTFPLMLPRVSPVLTAALVGAASSLVFDFVSRQKISDAHMKLFIWKQLPVPAPDSMAPHTSFITPRVLELVYTAYDMEGLARDLEDSGAPFQWDEDRRAQMRAELDAYFFHLYGLDRDDTEYVLETFQTKPSGGLKHNEIAQYGEFRTKRLVLAEYDRMANAGLSMEHPLVDGENYTSTLAPPPGRGARHSPRPGGN